MLLEFGSRTVHMILVQDWLVFGGPGHSVALVLAAIAYLYKKCRHSYHQICQMLQLATTHFVHFFAVCSLFLRCL